MIEGIMNRHEFNGVTDLNMISHIQGQSSQLSISFGIKR